MDLRASKEFQTAEKIADQLAKFSEQEKSNGSQRNKDIVMKFSFTPEKIMMLLSKERLQKLEKLWEEYPDGLELPLFTQLMIDSIDCSEEEKYELVHGALKLFSEIDINGDAHMEWSEFMQYIIDAVVENSISSGGGGNGKDENQKISVMELIEQMKANKFLRFYMAYQPIDKSNHNNYIMNAVYSKKANLIFTFEKYQKDIKFYSSDLKFKEKFRVPLRVEGFILDIAFSDSQNTFGVTASDSQLHFYSNNSKGIRFMKSIVTPGIQNKIWHLPHHKCWITAGRDLRLRQWDPFKSESLIDTFNTNLEMHNQDIMDICEIEVPFSIATCSLDKKIIIYNLVEKEIIRVLEGDHIKGVKRLSYNGHFGGHLVSVGHEIYANVWGPESLISDILIGKLKGHTKPIIDTKFISITPFNVTIDEKNNIRIWDIRTLVCLQLIKGKVQTAAQGLCCIENNVFWVFGKRFVQFDTYSVDEGGEEQIDLLDKENYPIWAEFNNHYMTINVVNKHEVKLYDSSNGQLTKIHSSLVDHSQKQEITQFKQDLRHRKSYIGDTFGKIKVYNISNGVPLKDVTDNDQNDSPSSDDQDKLSLSSESSINEENQDYFNNSSDEDKVDQSHKEITGMQLIWEEEYIMMVCSDHKYIYVYDEDDTEQSILLRKLTGAHKEEITIIKYDDHLSLIASGSLDGEIALWDFEMSKLLGMCIGHTGDITGIEFLSPQPLMVTSSLDCTICIWGVRPSPIAYKHVCLYRFENISWNYNKDSSIPVSKILVVQEQMRGIQRYKRIKEGFLSASKYGSFNVNVLFKRLEEKVKGELISETEKNHKPKMGLLSKLLGGIKSQNKNLNENEQSGGPFITQVQYVDQNYDKNVDREINRCYLYIADEIGFIKVWDFTTLINKIGFSMAPSYPKTKVSFNPKRKELIDCSIYAASVRKEYIILLNTSQIYSAKRIQLPELLNPEKIGIFIREVKAHRECIVSMNYINLERKGLITCSTDKRVRIWSSFLDLWGTIDQRRERLDKKWNFPKDFKNKQKEEEIGQVKELLAEVDIDPNKNLIFNDENTEESSKAKKSQKFWLQSKKKAIIEQTQLQKTDRSTLSNVSANGGVIDNIDKRIAEFDIKMKIMQMDYPRQYHGYAKELEKLFDNKFTKKQNFDLKKHITQTLNTTTDASTIQETQNHQIDLSTYHSNNKRMTLLKANQDHQNSSSAFRIRKGDMPINNDYSTAQLGRQEVNSRVKIASRNFLSRLEKSKNTSKSIIGNELERDKSKLMQFKDVPKIRDKIGSLTNQRSKSQFATPLRMRKNLVIEQHISSNFQFLKTLLIDHQVDDNKFLDHQIVPTIKLPPMNITPKHRNYSFENKQTSSTTKKLKYMNQLADYSSRNYINQNTYELNSNQDLITQGGTLIRNAQQSIKSKLNLKPRKEQITKNRTQIYGKGSLISQTMDYRGERSPKPPIGRVGQFLTSEDQDDAMHIKTDFVINDDQFDQKSVSNHNYNSELQERKEKYYGQNSRIKLLVKQENIKLQEQRSQLKIKMKLPKYPIKNQQQSQMQQL